MICDEATYGTLRIGSGDFQPRIWRTEFNPFIHPIPLPRYWIKRELGIDLTPSDELLNLYRQHNRARTRTGALVDEKDIFRKRNLDFTIGIWRIVDNTRFIIGSRGGCRVEHGDLNVHLFPVDPKIAVSLVGRSEANEFLGGNVQMGNPRIVIKHDIPGKTGISARIVNKAMWSGCDAVAGLKRKDVEEAKMS